MKAMHARAAALFALFALSHCRKSRSVDPVVADVATTVTLAPDAASPLGATTAAQAPSSGECEALVHAPADRADIRDLQLTSRHLVWREGPRLMAWERSSGASGPKRTILTDPRLRASAADDQFVFVATDAGVFRAPLDSGAPLERMLTPTGLMATYDDMMVTSTHVIVSRNFGEIVKISKAPPFTTQVFSQRAQRRNVFARWTVSEHAAWFARPGRGLGSSGWVRLDLDTGAVAALGDASSVHSRGASVVLVRGALSRQRGSGNVAGNNLGILAQNATQLFSVNEATGAVEPAPFWSGSLSFGFALGEGRVAFRSTIERADAGLPTMGWITTGFAAETARVLRRCPQGSGLFITMLAAVDDGANVYVISHDLQHGHRILTLPATS